MDDELSKSRNEARIADHAAWAARGRWKDAYEALLAELGPQKNCDTRIIKGRGEV